VEGYLLLSVLMFFTEEEILLYVRQERPGLWLGCSIEKEEEKQKKEEEKKKN